MPRAVLLDLFNTVVDGGEDEREVVTAAMARDLGVDAARFALLVRQTWPQRSTGATGDLETTVRQLAVRAGGAPTDARVRLACARRVELVRRLLWPRSQTLAALDALRAAGWQTALVTNATVEVPPLWKTTPLARRFDAVVFSCALGVAKPDPAIYLAALGSLGAQPGDCVYLGDGADDELAGAAAVGLSVVRTTEFREAEASWPRSRVGSMSEFVAWLTTSVTGRPG